MLLSKPYALAPDVPGITFRHLRVPDDYRSMNAIANAVRAADGNDWATSDEQFIAFYRNLANRDLDRDVLIAERDGAIVGYGRATWNEMIDGLRAYTPISFVDPSARAATELLRAIHDTMEGRIREVAATHPGGPRQLRLQVGERAVALESIVRARGYQPVRYEYVMVRPTLDDLPDAPLPAGLEIREVRPEHLRAIWEAANEAFADDRGATIPTEEDYQQFLNDPVQGDTSLWRVAWDGPEIAGMVRSFVNATENERFGRQRGWVEHICVRRPWRRRGLARALIAASFPLLRARGMTEGALGVDAQNPSGALRLYESCGFVVDSRATEYARPFE